MRRAIFPPIFLDLNVHYLLLSAGLTLLTGGLEMIFAAARNQFLLSSSKYNELFWHGMEVSIDKEEPSVAFSRKSLARRLWRRPKQFVFAFLLGAIAATMCITFLILSCFRSLGASYSRQGTKRNLQNGKAGWLCNVRTVKKIAFF